jgi:predicted enzyme related to lactoylglutathione lyase
MKATIRIHPPSRWSLGRRGRAAADPADIARQHSFTKILLFAAFLLVLLSSCASKKVIVPSITQIPTKIYHHGKFVWFDLITNDIPIAKKFYGELLGWEFEDHPQDTVFTMIHFKNKPIGSIIYLKRKDPNVSESRWLSSLSVPDVDAAVEYFRNNGGTIYREAKNYPNRGRLAVVADPQGAILALLKASNGDPVDTKPDFNEWFWDELITNDVDAAIEFYQGLLDYESDTREVTKGITYHILKRESLPRAGVVKSPWEDVPPNWLPYIRVEAPRALADRVKSLGGELVLPPDENIRNGTVAIVADPTGAVLALQKWPIDEQIKE